MDGTKVLKFENRKAGGYLFETTDLKGVKYRFNGVFHEIIAEKKITRTFEMENTPFDVQLEFLEFEKVTAEKSRLNMYVVYKSGTHRDQLLQMPFRQGINFVHNRLEEILQKSR